MLSPHLHHRDLDRLRRLVRTRPRPMRPIRQTTYLLGQIPADPPLHRGAMHPEPGRHLTDLSAREDRPDRVQTLLHHRQDNQCQSRPPESETPHGDARNQGADHGR
jgi:hypothetical protein